MTKTCYLCKNEYEAQDQWDMSCPRCAKLPTIQFTLVADDEYGCPYTVLSGRTVQAGRHADKNPNQGITPYSTIRGWAADALAHGSTNVRLQLERHTRDLGWSGSERFARSREVYKTVRLNVQPRAF